MKHNYDIFEQYLNGEMQGQDLSDFENRIKTNNELAAELELFRKVKDGISSKLNSEKGAIALNKTINGIEGEFFTEVEEKESDQSGAKVVSMNRRFLMTAIAVAASILLLVFVWQPWQKTLYEQYAQFPAAEFTSRSADAFDFKAMEEAYNNKDFKGAIVLFDQFLVANSEDAEVLLFKGISHLNVNDLDKAEATFTQLSSGNSAFKNDGNWYLALTHFKQDDKKSCIEALKNIPEGADKYADAQKLISALL